VFLGCVPPSTQEQPQVHIEPALPTTIDDLQVVFDRGDVGANWRYRWFRGEDLVEDLDEATVPASATAKEQTWHVVVGTGDGFNDFVEGQAEVTIVNSAPVVTVTVSPEAPLATEDVTALPEATDADGDELTLSFAWKRSSDGQVLESQTLNQTWTAKGDVWTVTVLASDGTAEGAPATATVSIENSAPEVVSALIGSGTYFTDSVVSVAITLQDSDADEVTATIEWLADGAVVQTGSSEQLESTLTSKHQQIQARITPNDGFVDGNPVLSNTIEILNSAPWVDVAGWEPDALFESSTADCTPDSGRILDADGDTVTLAWRWTVGGTDVGVSAATLGGASFDKGEDVRCFITASDEETAGSEAELKFGPVENSIPTLASVSLSPTTPTVQDTLTATVSGLADPDPADSPMVNFTWTVGSGGSTAGGSSLSLASYSKGDILQVSAEATDGEATSAAVTDSVTIVNSPPSLNSISLSHAEAGTDDNLNLIAWSTDDPDGDTVTTSWSWAVNGQAIAETGAVLSGITWFDRGDTVQVTGTPHDGDENGPSLASALVSVVNTPPTPPLAAVMLTNDPFAIPPSDELFCGIPSHSTDTDNDPVTYSFSWTLDGVPYTGSVTNTATQSNIASSATWPGQQWVCSVTPNDGFEDGTAGTASFDIPVPCGSLELAGLSDFPMASDSPSVSGDATLEIWFFANSVHAADNLYGPVILDYADSYLQLCDIGTPILAWDHGFGVPYTCTNYITVGTWQHLAFVNDPSAGTTGEVRAYLDGSLLPTQWSGSNTMTFGATGPFYLGRHAHDNVNQFNGSIGEIRLWDRALSQSEIQSGMTRWLDTLNETDLVAHWTFAEGGGNTAYDQTNSGIDFNIPDETSWSTSNCPY
jgi:hypothetical protein